MNNKWLDTYLLKLQCLDILQSLIEKYEETHAIVFYGDMNDTLVKERKNSHRTKNLWILSKTTNWMYIKRWSHTQLQPSIITMANQRHK